MFNEIAYLNEIAAMKALAAETEHLERLSGLLLVKVTEQRERMERLVDNPPPQGEKDLK